MHCVRQTYGVRESSPEGGPRPTLKASADKIALSAGADGIQLKVETTPRFSSQSIGAIGRAQGAVEDQIRCLGLELKTRLSIEATPAMDIWPWLVRHAGSLLERYHVKGNKTAFEGLFREAAPRRGHEVRGGSSFPFGRVSQREGTKQSPAGSS